MSTLSYRPDRLTVYCNKHRGWILSNTCSENVASTISLVLHGQWTQVMGSPVWVRLRLLDPSLLHPEAAVGHENPFSKPTILGSLSPSPIPRTVSCQPSGPSCHVASACVTMTSLPHAQPRCSHAESSPGALAGLLNAGRGLAIARLRCLRWFRKALGKAEDKSVFS